MGESRPILLGEGGGLDAGVLALVLLEGFVLDIKGLRTFLAVFVVVRASLDLDVYLLAKVPVLHYDCRVFAAEAWVIGAHDDLLSKRKLDDRC